VFSLLAVLASAQEKEFSFKTYLLGEWNVERFTVSMTTSEMVPVSTGKYVFNADTETTNIVGYWSPDEVEDEDGLQAKIPVLVEFDSSNTGNFKTGEDEDVLFSFYFQHFNGPWISHGEWNGQTSAFYQFNIVANDKFTITVYPNPVQEDAEVTIYSASRVKSGREKTFFEKYGSTMMMVGGFMLFQQLKGDGGRAAAAQGGGAPTVEERGPRSS